MRDSIPVLRASHTPRAVSYLKNSLPLCYLYTLHLIIIGQNYSYNE